MSVSVEGQPFDPYVDEIAPGKERMRYEMRGEEVMETGATDKPQTQVGVGWPRPGTYVMSTRGMGEDGRMRYNGATRNLCSIS